MKSGYHAAIEVTAESSKESSHHLIMGNVIEAFANSTGKTGYTCGVRLTGNCFLNQITDNTILEMDDYGIELVGDAAEEVKRPRNNRIAGNIIKSVKTNAIDLKNAYDNSITSNEIQYSGAVGVRVQVSGKGKGTSSKNNRITGNNMLQSAVSAIHIGEGSLNTIVYGNVGYGNKVNVVDKGSGTVTGSLE
ncbi:hypothetical protein D3C73_902830 [compost metagenome]